MYSFTPSFLCFPSFPLYSFSLCTPLYMSPTVLAFLLRSFSSCIISPPLPPLSLLFLFLPVSTSPHVLILTLAFPFIPFPYIHRSSIPSWRVTLLSTRISPSPSFRPTTRYTAEREKEKKKKKLVPLSGSPAALRWSLSS